MTPKIDQKPGEGIILDSLELSSFCSFCKYLQLSEDLQKYKTAQIMAFVCVSKNCDQDVLESLTYELQYVSNITGIALIFSRLVLTHLQPAPLKLKPYGAIRI